MVTSNYNHNSNNGYQVQSDLFVGNYSYIPHLVLLLGIVVNFREVLIDHMYSFEFRDTATMIA